MSSFWDICVLIIIIIFPLLDLRKGACLRLQQPFVQYIVASLFLHLWSLGCPSSLLPHSLRLPPPPLLCLILRPSFRFHFKKFFTSKQNEAKRDPFRMRSLLFASSFSVKIKGNIKGHTFSPFFCFNKFNFRLLLFLSLLSEKVASFLVQIFPFHFETKKQSVSLRLSFLFACFG